MQKAAHGPAVQRTSTYVVSVGNRGMLAVAWSKASEPSQLRSVVLGCSHHHGASNGSQGLSCRRLGQPRADDRDDCFCQSLGRAEGTHDASRKLTLPQNLVGSIHHFAPEQRIVIYDIGLFASEWCNCT